MQSGAKRGLDSPRRRYTRGVFLIMSAYVALTFVTSGSVHQWHPRGPHLYLAAALPTIPILCLAYIVARYLREEKDEYLRDMTVRSLLWGTAAAMCVSVFSDFLHAYGGTRKLPDFSVFVVFWLSMGSVRMVQALRNRGGEDA